MLNLNKNDKTHKSETNQTDDHINSFKEIYPITILIQKGFVFKSRIVYFSKREGKLVCLLRQSPKFYNNIFLCVCLSILGTLMNFDRLDHQVECSNVSTTNFNLQNGYFCVSSLGMYINLSTIVLSLRSLIFSLIKIILCFDYFQFELYKTFD